MHAGLTINPDRPHDKLPYRGAWLWIGTEMIHVGLTPHRKWGSNQSVWNTRILEDALIVL